jgi:hypothetical protein
MDIEIYKNVNVGLPIQQNAFWNMMNGRKSLLQDPDTPITETKIQIFTVDRDIVIQNQTDFSSMSPRDVDGKTWINLPISSVRTISSDESILDRSTTISYISSGTVIIVFYYRGNYLDLVCAYPKQMIHNILSSKISSAITMQTSNVSNILCLTTIDDRTVAYFEKFTNVGGSWEGVSVIFSQDENFFKTRYPGIYEIREPAFWDIGVNEKIEYSKDQFIKDFTIAFKFGFEKLYPDQNVEIREVTL